MKTIAVNDIQNDSGFFTHLVEALAVIDHRDEKIVAYIYPSYKNHVTNKLAGKYKNRSNADLMDIEAIKETAMRIAMEEKYGRAD